MDLRAFDLNLLRVLDALLKERNVTQAARRLDMSQPAVSAALTRLRAAFDDELFVKHARGVDPTPRALELEAPLASALDTIQAHILDRPAFDPAATQRCFVLITGEVGQQAFVPRLLPRLRALAPHASLRFVFPDAAERAAMLEDGRADLAVGHFPQFTSSALYQQKLYARPLVCVARVGHPLLADEAALTPQRLGTLDHLVVGSHSGFDLLVEPALRKQGVRRRVAAELGHVSGAFEVLGRTDLVAIVPEMLAAAHARAHALRVWPLPFELPLYEVKQFWHRKLHRDPALAWLREQVAGEFQPA